jgi:hypothetical protein
MVFRNSAVPTTIMTLVMSGLVVVAGYLVIHGRIASFRLPRPLAVGEVLFFLLLVLIFGSRLRATRRPTNWLMRIRGNDVLVKFRSYQNWRLPEDETQVIELQRNEIAFVRQLKQKQVTQEMHGRTEVDRRVVLEIGLKDTDTTVLEKALAAEVARPGWGNEHYRTKVSDYPVRAEKGVIRIAWRNESTLVRPGIKRVLRELGRIAEVINQQTGIDDYTPAALKKLPEEEQRKKLMDLAQRDPVAAVETARKLYGYSLAEANQVVEGLIAAGANPQTKG